MSGGGSSDGRLGVGSTGGGIGSSVSSPVAVVVEPWDKDVSVGLELGDHGVQRLELDGPEVERLVHVVGENAGGGGGGGRMTVGVPVGMPGTEEVENDGGGGGELGGENPGGRELGVGGVGGGLGGGGGLRVGDPMVLEDPGTDGLGTGGSGLEVPVGIGGPGIDGLLNDGVIGGQGIDGLVKDGSGIGDGPEMDGLGVDGSGIGVPVGLGGPDRLGVVGQDIVKELVSEEAIVLTLELTLVNDDRLGVRLVCDVEEGPVGKETERDELDWLGFSVDTVELIGVESTDEENVNVKLPDMELGRDELLLTVLAVLVTGELLGGRGTGVHPDILLVLGGGIELDRVVSVDQTLDVRDELGAGRLGFELCPGGMTIVSVDDHALDVWLEIVTELCPGGITIVSVDDHALDVWFETVADGLGDIVTELCPGGTTIVVVVGKGSAVNVVEDWTLLLSPLVVLKAVEFSEGVEGEEVADGGRLPEVGGWYVLKPGVE